MRIVVMGGSAAGLTAAVLAARAGHEVTVLDRTRPGLPTGPEDAWSEWRRLQQPHAFLPGLRQLLRQHFPAASGSLDRDGAAEIPAAAGGPAGLACRRTTLELALRRDAAAAPIAISHASSVTGLEISDGRVTAVLAARAGARVRIGADLVVDATGRHTKAGRWLPGGARTRRAPCGMTVWSRFYQAPTPPRLAGGVSESVMGPGWCWYGFAGDAGACSLSLAGPLTLPRPDLAEFEAAAGQVPFARQLLDAAEPAGPLRRARVAATALRRCHVPGLLLTGDAMITTNPAYGLGVMLAAEQAVLLAGLLSSPGTPHRICRQWSALTAARYTGLWEWAAAQDTRRRDCWAAGRTPAPAVPPPGMAA